MKPEDMATMYNRWMDAWNGDPAVLDELVGVIHQPPNTFAGRNGVVEMVARGRAPFATIRFEIEVAPIIEGSRLAARWQATGTYAGGLPGATATPGTTVTFSGIDIWRVENGLVAEYWTSSDGIHLMSQLGAMG